MAMRMRGERVPTGPSETRQGIEWLTNFAPGDTAAAQLLLNSLHVVSETTFRQELSEQLRSTLTTDVNVPAALYSVRSCRLTDTMFIGDVSPLVSSGDGGGSELIVQNILRATERSLDTAVGGGRAPPQEQRPAGGGAGPRVV
ncbi:hypothetical protein ACFWC9_34630 [Streptomyces goshikiensis]|uniref:hypothetical protein n=1 Tax=Streptomyces goshikiensis TaxID=1942 RepID=UPI00367E6882